MRTVRSPPGFSAAVAVTLPAATRRLSMQAKALRTAAASPSSGRTGLAIGTRSPSAEALCTVCA